MADVTKELLMLPSGTTPRFITLKDGTMETSREGCTPPSK